MSKIAMKDDDQIQRRQVGDEVPELSTLDPGVGQYQFGDLKQFVEFAKVMCQAGPMLPKHAQNNPAICLALTMRAVHWGFDPFALADESYQAKEGGPVGYQAKVFTAVLRRAGVKLRYRYEGAIKIVDKPVKSYNGKEVAKRTATGDRKCIAYIIEDDEEVMYETMTLDQITIKNSPLWHNDPDQQLAYYAGRGWARRHRPDLMMGAYSKDEVEQMPMQDITPKETGFARRAEQARLKAHTEPQGPDQPDPPDEAEQRTTDEISGDNEVDPENYTGETPEAYAIDPEGQAYAMGATAAEEGFPDRDQSPLSHMPAEHANWLAGYDAALAEKENAK